jgi:hypothetical protein
MPNDLISPKGMGIKMMKTRIIPLIISGMLFNVFIYGQVRICLTNGQSINNVKMEIGQNAAVLIKDSLPKTIAMKDILYIIGGDGNCYTYKIKNDRKMKIRKSLICDNYLGTDRARIFAAKYDGTRPDVKELYILNSDENISEADFTKAFTAQQKKYSRAKGIAFSSFILSLGAFIAALSQLNSIE